MTSPLKPIFLNPQEIPEAFRIQFLHSPDDDYDAFLEGTLEEVWFHPKWLAPLFWFLEAIGILIAERGKNIRTTLRVQSFYDENGEPYQEWYRRYYGSKVRKFDVTVVYDKVSNRAIDLVGPKRFLALAWNADYIAPDTFRLDVIDAGIQFNKRIIWLPQWLWQFCLGKEYFTQKVVSDEDNRVTIDLRIKHVLFGDVFGYKGTFEVKTVSKQA